MASEVKPGLSVVYERCQSLDNSPISVIQQVKQWLTVLIILKLLRQCKFMNRTQFVNDFFRIIGDRVSSC